MAPRKKVKLKRKPIQAKAALEKKIVQTWAKGIDVEGANSDAFNEELKTYSFSDVKSNVIEFEPAYGSYDWAVAQSQKLLGLSGDAWCATATARGMAYARPRYRIGMYSDVQSGTLEGGKTIIGSGASYIEALQDAYRRAMKLNICELDYVFQEREDLL